MTMCGCNDPETYVHLPQKRVTSPGTEFCIECGSLIPCGTRHYHVWVWSEDEHGNETHLAEHRACTVCGDLATPFLAAGCCWMFGTLRDDIEEMNFNEGNSY